MNPLDAGLEQSNSASNVACITFNKADLVNRGLTMAGLRGSPAVSFNFQRYASKTAKWKG